MSEYIKNVAFSDFSFGLISKTDASDITTGTVTGNIKKDAGVFATITGAVTYTSDGIWEVDLTQTEMNADKITLTFSHATALKATFFITTIGASRITAAEVRTEMDSNSTQLAAIIVDTTAIEVDTVAIGAETTAIKTKTDFLPSATAGGAGGLPTGDANNRVAANIEEVGGDTTAATNLKNQYDGSTGLTGDDFPATQAQVGSLSTGSASISRRTNNGVVTVGTVVGGTTYVNTYTLDGVYHSFTEDGSGNLDAQYSFNVGGNGVAVDIVLDGYFSGNGDIIMFQAYNYVGSVWEDIGSITTSSGSNVEEFPFSLDVQHTGTGVDIGEVEIRAYEVGGGLSSIQLNIDRIRIDYSVVSQSVGYDGGRVWVNTTDGTAGTESFVNGVADNPVLTFADALTISSNLKLRQFQISPESTLSPTADLNSSNVYGVGYAINLGGHDYAGTHFFHASPVNGVATSVNNSDHLDILDSIIQDITVDDSHFTRCSFKGTVTFGSVSSDIRVIDSRSVIAGSSTPIFDFGTATANHNLTIADWQNGIEIRNFNAATGGGTDLFSLSGTGQIIIAASCDGGVVNLRGQWKVTDNSGGAVTIVYDNVAQNVIETLEDTADMQGSGVFVTATGLDLVLSGSTYGVMALGLVASGLATYDPPTTAEMNARTLVAASYSTFDEATDTVDIGKINGVAGAASNLGLAASTQVTGTITGSGSTTTVLTTGLTEATDDHYNGRLLTFTSGVLQGQFTSISDYNGTTKEITVIALTEAPATSVNFIIV